MWRLRAFNNGQGGVLNSSAIIDMIFHQHGGAIIGHSEAEITWWLPCFFGDERKRGVRLSIFDSTRAQCSTYVAGTKNKRVIDLKK